MLDDRKLKVLQAIINSYIASAEPIGSRTISKKYDLGVSPATIRNEMSDLEDLGYLNKPYTSAGRIPSDKAYRLYVDTLMQEIMSFVDFEKKEEVKKILLKEMGEIDQLIQNSAKILSKITNYTSLAIAPQFKQSTLKHIQLISIDECKVLVIIISESGAVRNTIFRTDNFISDEQLTAISNFLNGKLKGLTLEEISNEIDSTIFKEMYEFRSMIQDIVPVISQSLEDMAEIEVYANGVTNKNIDKAKSFLSFIEDKELLADALLENTFDDIFITIGDENPCEEIKDCSLITATYKFGGKTVGKIGVIGPTRMDYYKVIKAVRVIAVNLSEIIDYYFAGK